MQNVSLYIYILKYNNSIFLDLGEKVTERSVVALLNGESLWHMHRPIPDACKLNLLHYQIENPTLVNKTFWRSCSFILGAVVTNAFKDNVRLHLHSFPSPNGNFVVLVVHLLYYFFFSKIR